MIEKLLTGIARLIERGGTGEIDLSAVSNGFVELRGESDASVWLVRGDRYMRMPRNEAERPCTPAIDAALDDLIWHMHVGVSIVVQDGEARLRLIPLGRAPGSGGVVSGPIRRLSTTQPRSRAPPGPTPQRP